MARAEAGPGTCAEQHGAVGQPQPVARAQAVRACVAVKSRRASWESDQQQGKARAQRRAVVARSWYGGYGALAEEEEDRLEEDPGSGGSLTDVGAGRCARKSGIDLVMPSLKNLVSMATLSRRRSSSTTALNSPREIPRMPSSAKSVAALPLLREPLRKCDTSLALSNMLPVRPVNRLRVSTSKMCSRCSSILSMASSSRYSINTTGFVQVSQPDCRGAVLCKLCLNEVPSHLTWTLQQCSCTFCIECMRAYVEFEINEGAYEISCPDALCEKQGVITMAEIERLVTEDNLEKHKRFRLNREVELDKSRTWCPRAGCETVCTVCAGAERCVPQPVHCPTCATDFCSNCRASWHAGTPCRPQDLAQPIPGITFDSELIKCCPMCAVPIEKDEGCAQMMCKRCKHVFCWYCLASLDDDFLLRHYDKGPCKNKLGHSRASVIWHRTQVIGIFAGFGILLLVASPLLLLAAPCIVCCKCRVCSGGGKLEPEEDLPEEGAT
ncbi:E3 ubiquitin-protein ligase RNF144A [Homalodisca vitripennis]|uniref:E3 ubiquitin-protein ligase RNF144B n=1 Tax=Homalodisca liturata TaxID=320908 RepID=A0A1B6IE33_9HEMI|nr:E3 ubiquitin-protein ligase RNF144A [Homalodisca vitripennis]XP_046659701.1 E3 ubiquitin-protein ligase RNF144A [Homalodisca vitripennis]XP_046659702.1 E3 ubiquitin-protein ligase RNF144A [Homalodisca vitripennis]XP_046659703.1 E3 ubiquitin-protein ligase RNF144A [Homalodisca vitripennis]